MFTFIKKKNTLSFYPFIVTSRNVHVASLHKKKERKLETPSIKVNEINRGTIKINIYIYIKPETVRAAVIEN